MVSMMKRLRFTASLVTVATVTLLTTQSVMDAPTAHHTNWPSTLLKVKIVSVVSATPMQKEDCTGTT